MPYIFIETASTFVPRVCEDLKENWFPNMSIEDIQNNKRIRNVIRNRILDEWSKERNEKAVWVEDTVRQHFPIWLKDQNRVKRRNNVLQIQTMQ